MKYQVFYSADEGFVRLSVFEPITAELKREFSVEAIDTAKKAGV